MAGIVVAVELFAIAWIRNRFLEVSMRSSLLVVTVGGAIVLAIGVGDRVFLIAERDRAHAQAGLPPATRWYTGAPPAASSPRRK